MFQQCKYDEICTSPSTRIPAPWSKMLLFRVSKAHQRVIRLPCLSYGRYDGGYAKGAVFVAVTSKSRDRLR